MSSSNSPQPQTPTESSEKVAEPEAPAEEAPPPPANVEDGDYTPRLYTFHVQGHSVGPDGAATRMPPYWLLIDHTLAVVWAMSSPKTKSMPIGINQLQWALLLLGALKTRRGDHTPDVKMMIDAIEDRLLDLYAAVARRTAGDETFRANHHKSFPSDRTPTKSALKDADASVDGQEVKVVSYSPEVDETPTTPPTPMQRVAGTSGTGQMSVCYADIMKHCPLGAERKMQATRGGLRPRRLFDQDSAEYKDDDSEAAEDASKMCTEGPSPESQFTKEYLMNFMTDWRADQMKRLENDMSRLAAIEQFMTKIDKDNFDPYVDPQVVRRLEEITKDGNA